MVIRRGSCTLCVMIATILPVSSGCSGCVTSLSPQATLDTKLKLVYSHDVSEDGRYAVTGGGGGKLRLIDVSSGEIAAEKVIGRPASSVQAVAFTPDGKSVITADDDGEITTWSVPTLEKRLRFPDELRVCPIRVVFHKSLGCKDVIPPTSRTNSGPWSSPLSRSFPVADRARLPCVTC